MKNQHQVSIIINNYNYGRFIQQAIDSALSQSYPHIEVIVVDDGSTDNSREIIAKYEDQIIPILKVNGGQTSAFNAGFAASQGDIICFLDSDDIFMPSKVAEIASVFDTYPSIDWCFHRMRLVDAYTGNLIELSPESLSRECDYIADMESGKLDFNPPATSGLCFKRSLLKLILPMFEDRISADRYVKLMAVALGKGYFLGEQLTIQQIHGSNALTKVDGKEQYRAREFVVTAYWIKAKCPKLAKFTNNLFAVGLGTYWRTGGVEIKYRNLIKEYLLAVSSPERIEIYFRAIYHSSHLLSRYRSWRLIRKSGKIIAQHNQVGKPAM